ncbi:MAG: glycoside hydrolase family 3 C-terminal domain-containing protein [Chthoniobacteraceae bacterium]
MPLIHKAQKTTQEPRDDEKINQLVKEMTLDEKIDLISGVDFMFTKGVPRLGVKRVRMADASMGLRDGRIPATAFPAMIALAATWDRERAHEYGAAAGEEFRAAGVDVLLGPGVNIYRLPECGRNFEYLGEDPFLAGAMASHYIQGAQSQGVAATVKHLAANNQDWHRCASNSVVDERTLREIYLPAFEEAIADGGVLSIMTSYNLLNGEYTSESSKLIKDMVLGEWGFEGVVMSDWEGTWSADKAFDSGLHLEMPGGKTWKPEIVKELLKDSAARHAELDRKVSRILKWTFAIEKLQANAGKGKAKCSEHVFTALDISRKGVVLLKNANALLPLKNQTARVNIVGPCAFPTPTSGGGAALVEAVDPKSILGSLLQIAPGLQLARGETGMEEADAVIVCVGFGPQLEQEGMDRSFELPWEQEALVRRCVAANPRTIVIVLAGGAVGMNGWIDKASAVIYGWYPGEIGALAIAEILMGVTNPSGRLPISIERRHEDGPAHGNYLPDGGVPYQSPDYTSRARETFDVRYEEGIFCGYRHYDRAGVEALFPFGHGLSYTTFEYSALSISRTDDNGIEAVFNVKNTGDRPGEEVAQLYIGAIGSPVPRPRWELKGFERLAVDAGKTVSVRISVKQNAFCHYDENSGWKSEPGVFVIGIGSSAGNIHLTQEIAL